MYFRPFLFLTLIFALAAQAAEKSDAITIAAKRLQYSDSDGSSLYQGEVELHQGESLALFADELLVKQIDGKVVYFESKGVPARFSHQNKDNRFSGKAKLIQYHPDTGEISLIGEAHIDHNGDLFSGEKMNFNLVSNQLTAEGDQEHTDERGRVQVIIQPRDQ